MLQEQLQWQDYGPKCTASRLLPILFYAAAQLCSLFAACSRLGDALRARCPEPAMLEVQFNRRFAQQLPKTVPRSRQRLAIDLTLVPCPGQPRRRVEELSRSQAKGGTTPFHAYATCYVVHRGALSGGFDAR